MNKCNLNEAKINEIFDSIQGEGPYIGYRQLFVRFCGCNLMCDYCDTEFEKGEDYSVSELLAKIKTFDPEPIHSVSLTGGEPLLHYEFLKEFLPELKRLGHKVYLETNGTMAKALEQVVEFVDIVSMDIKVDSSAKIGDVYSKHKSFLEVSKSVVGGKKREVFAKLVFDEDLKDFEINECLKLVEEFQVPLVLQPKMRGNEIGITSEKIMEFFDIFSRRYQDTRLIGQVHKFFDIR